MHAEQLQVSVVTFNAAIQACQKCGRWKQALQLLEEMQCCKKMQPNLVTYNGVLPEYFLGGGFRYFIFFMFLRNHLIFLVGWVIWGMKCYPVI